MICDIISNNQQEKNFFSYLGSTLLLRRFLFANESERKSVWVKLRYGGRRVKSHLKFLKALHTSTLFYLENTDDRRANARHFEKRSERAFCCLASWKKNKAKNILFSSLSLPLLLVLYSAQFSPLPLFRLSFICVVLKKDDVRIRILHSYHFTHSTHAKSWELFALRLSLSLHNVLPEAVYALHTWLQDWFGLRERVENEPLCASPSSVIISLYKKSPTYAERYLHSLFSFFC